MPSPNGNSHLGKVRLFPFLRNSLPAAAADLELERAAEDAPEELLLVGGVPHLQVYRLEGLEGQAHTLPYQPDPELADRLVVALVQRVSEAKERGGAEDDARLVPGEPLHAGVAQVRLGAPVVAG